MHTMSIAMKKSLQQASLKNLFKTIRTAITIAHNTLKILIQSLWWLILPFSICTVYVTSHAQSYAKIFMQGVFATRPFYVILFYVIFMITVILALILAFYSIIAVRLASGATVRKSSKLLLLSYTNCFGGYVFFVFLASLIRLSVFVVPQPLQVLYNCIVLIFSLSLF